MTKRFKTQSSLSYFGSDSEVAPRLAEMLSHCNHVTIPFCGGLAILPYLTARAIVANDLHEHVINFYKVLAGLWGDRDNLVEQCVGSLSHPAEMERARQVLDDHNNGCSPCRTDRAWAFWAQCWIGRKGKGGTISPAAMPSVRRTASGGTNASRLRAAANDLGAWAKQLERCEFECVCFRELLPKVADNPKCGLYVDAPWVEVGDQYLHSFEAQDHIDLASLLRRFDKTTVVVRYGDHELIRAPYSDWTISKAASRTQTNAVKGELWILNR